MEEIKKRLAAVGVAIPRILLPAPNVELERFAVIACDQHSADPSYWDAVEALAGDRPSALRMILPEAWLKTPARAGDPNAAMARYLESGALRELEWGMVYVRRQTLGGIRQGLLLALDLDRYDYTKESRAMIRATEATVAERLPARIALRRDAPLELPHVMALVDDPDNLLMGSLERATSGFDKLYDFELMMDGGHIEGYRIADNTMLSGVAAALEALMERASDGFLYAVGDGNHSLAAAKACWEEIKSGLPDAERDQHPARYALVELVNLHDPALRFEPIHRALLGVDPAAAQREIGFAADSPPPLQRLQPMLDDWLALHPEAELEYIHGEEACRALCDAPDRLAVILPPFDKSTLFSIVQIDGALVRKSFSMGEASDKRYYLEGRKIR